MILAASGLSLPYAPENLRLNSSKLTYLFLSFFFAQERINVRLNISSSNSNLEGMHFRIQLNSDLILSKL